MRLRSTLTVSFRALRRNAMRSLLTALGIIIGVGAVIAMVSIGNGAKSMVEAQIAALGENVLLVFPGSFSQGGARSGAFGAGTLTIDDADAIKREVLTVIGVSPEVRTSAQVLANGLNWSTQILGEGADYLAIRAWPLSDGAMFTDADVRSVAKVCIIGQTIATQLFPEGSAIGQTLRIKSQPFKVVGILNAKGLSVQGSDQDDLVVIPYTSAMRRVSKQTMLRSISVQASSPDTMTLAENDITALLRQRHRTSEGSDDFTVRSQVEIAQAATATSNTMTLLLGAIAGVSLIVGGIGIMNIMLVSVTERTREIGIRLAVGAHGREIQLQFLMESIVLSALGGTIGILLGIGASELLSHLNNWPTLVSTTAVVVAFVFSAVVGMVFGYYPARKASLLDPIDALRYE
ncbi:MAG: multidrug transporter substrate-binding protein [Verrucomicrobia bacterium]|nr:multidrug transporter substrate-binding protein [Verrucomicrobiota bacterium]